MEQIAQEQQKPKENTDKFVTHTLLAESLFHTTPISCQIWERVELAIYFLGENALTMCGRR